MFVEKPFNYPRLNAGFDEIRMILDEITNVLGLGTFTEEDCRHAVASVKKKGMLTLKETSFGGKARDYIKLFRWLGLTTIYSLKKPVKSILTSKGHRFLSTDSKSDEYRNLLRDIVLSWKMYPHLYVARRVGPDQKIRPGFVLTELLYHLNKPCRSEDVYLAVMRAGKEDLLAMIALVNQIQSAEAILENELSKVTLTRMDNVISEVRKHVKASKSFSAFVRRIRKFTHKGGEKSQWGWTTFRKGNLGYTLVQRYFKRELTREQVVKTLVVKNNRQQANRIVGPFVKLLIQADIVRRKGKRGFELTPSFVREADTFLQRPTIWYDDVVKASVKDWLAGYVIGLLNAVLLREQKSIRINTEGLVQFLCSDTKKRRWSTLGIDLAYVPNDVRRILDFLISMDVIRRVGEDSVEVTKRLDFDIGYDVPRELLDYHIFTHIVDDINADAAVFSVEIVPTVIHHISFTEDICSRCIEGNGHELRNLPCVAGCREDMGVPRIGMVQSRLSLKWQPMTCINCRQCYVIQPRANVRGDRRVISGYGVCPVEGAFQVDPTDKRLVPIHNKCVQCGLCGAFCPFGGIAFDSQFKPVLCDPKRCSQGCVSRCHEEGMGGIRTVDTEIDPDTIEHMVRVTGDRVVGFENSRISVPEDFVRNISWTVSENERLNPYVAYALQFIGEAEEVVSFARIPGSKDEIDILCKQLRGRTDLVCELKSGRKGKEGVPAIIAGQLVRYLSKYAQTSNEDLRGIVVKDLKNEKELSQSHWIESVLGLHRAHKNVLGVLSPNYLWLMVIQKMRNLDNSLLDLALDSDSVVVLDKAFEEEYHGNVIYEKGGKIFIRVLETQGGS